MLPGGAQPWDGSPSAQHPAIGLPRNGVSAPSPRCWVVGGDGSSNDQKQAKPTVVRLVEEGQLMLRSSVQVPEAEAAQVKDVMQKKEEIVFSS